MSDKLEKIIERAKEWSEADREELIARAEEIEQRHHTPYHPTAGELAAIDEADKSGVATDEEVDGAFRAFRRV